MVKPRSSSYPRVKKNRFLSRHNDSLSDGECVIEDTGGPRDSDHICELPEDNFEYYGANDSMFEPVGSSGFSADESINNSGHSERNYREQEPQGPQGELFDQSSTDADSVVDEHPVVDQPLNLRGEIKKWAIDNISNMDTKVVTEMLQILQRNGHPDLPSTAATLLGYAHSIKSQPMITKKNTVGKFVYLGIKNGLTKRLNSGVYTDNEIRVLVHIDGMTVYNNTQEQLWPILVKIFHDDYECLPFVVGLYYGNAKPKFVEEFLGDFVRECKELTEQGFTINDRTYSFKIMAIVGDGPARAYIKCIKGPGGFCACERCTVPGVTVNRKRVYPETSCPKRTKESFVARADKEHQPSDHRTPLLDIPGLDPVKDFPQEIMHLLYLNLMKNLLSYWVSSLRKDKLNILKSLLKNLTQWVPSEFQRKYFDISEYSRWKATQYSFMLLYVGAIVLQNVLPADEYCHFLHLSTACRILCSAELVAIGSDQAEQYLKTFVQCMPTYYGDDSQVGHIHSVIHIPEDARYFKTSLSNLSAFWGENFIGKLKDLVRARNQPLAQIVNRLNARENSESTIKLKKKEILSECVQKKKTPYYERNGDQFLNLDSVKYHDMKITDKSPNNVVELQNGRILWIERIFVSAKYEGKVKKPDNIFIEGFIDQIRDNVFTTPCPSVDVGILKVELSNSKKLFKLTHIKSKCVFLEIENQCYTISLLHADCK